MTQGEGGVKLAFITGEMQWLAVRDVLIEKTSGGRMWLHGLLSACFWATLPFYLADALNRHTTKKVLQGRK